MTRRDVFSNRRPEDRPLDTGAILAAIEELSQDIPPATKPIYIPSRRYPNLVYVLGGSNLYDFEAAVIFSQEQEEEL